MYLCQFKVGDIVSNNHGTVFEIKQVFSTYSVKVFVKECEEYFYEDVKGNFITPGNTYTVDILGDLWVLVSSKDSNTISEKSIEDMEKNLKNMQNEMDKLRKNIENAKKENIQNDYPKLEVGKIYVATESNVYFNKNDIFVIVCHFGDRFGYVLTQGNNMFTSNSSDEVFPKRALLTNPKYTQHAKNIMDFYNLKYGG